MERLPDEAEGASAAETPAGEAAATAPRAYRFGGPMYAPPDRALQIRTVAFDFAQKVEEEVDATALAADDPRFIWIDVDVRDVDLAERWLKGAEIVEETLVHAALRHESATHLARFDRYLHLVLSACRLEGDVFGQERVDVFVSETFLLTLHRGPVAFIDRVRQDYRADFQRFAQSPSFLIYELWDHLLDHFLQVQKHLEDRVEALQRDLIQHDDDAIFAKVSSVGAHLLYFRKVLLPARAVLSELSTRKSVFISEATQPFLSNMIGTLDRILQDALVDRDILTQSLNLHMSIVSHQTNRLMNKLTVVSVVFLPLSFLAAVYGMNFEGIPELGLSHGYALFWVASGVITLGLLAFLRRVRLL